jgi:hypothetical protein
MDIAATNAIVRTATAQASQTTSDAVNIAVLKKALNTQAAAAATMLQALPQPPQQPALATSGTLGTRLNTIA